MQYGASPTFLWNIPASYLVPLISLMAYYESLKMETVHVTTPEEYTIPVPDYKVSHTKRNIIFTVMAVRT
jgi:hypothetical protein